jgi:hypothetical protein
LFDQAKAGEAHQIRMRLCGGHTRFFRQIAQTHRATFLGQCRQQATACFYRLYAAPAFFHGYVCRNQ